MDVVLSELGLDLDLEEVVMTDNSVIPLEEEEVTECLEVVCKESSSVCLGLPAETLTQSCKDLLSICMIYVCNISY